METTLKDLLDDFDKALPNTINRKTLIKKYSYTLITHALGSGILNYDVGKPDELSLGSLGFSLLIQIRTKKSVDQLNNSIKKFNRSSDKLALILIFLTSVMLIAVSFQILLILL